MSQRSLKNVPVSDDPSPSMSPKTTYLLRHLLPSSFETKSVELVESIFPKVNRPTPLLPWE